MFILVGINECVRRFTGGPVVELIAPLLGENVAFAGRPRELIANWGRRRRGGSATSVEFLWVGLALPLTGDPRALLITPVVFVFMSVMIVSKRIGVSRVIDTVVDECERALTNIWIRHFETPQLGLQVSEICPRNSPIEVFAISGRAWRGRGGRTCGAILTIVNPGGFAFLLSIIVVPVTPPKANYQFGVRDVHIGIQAIENGRLLLARRGRGVIGGSVNDDVPSEMGERKVLATGFRPHEWRRWRRCRWTAFDFVFRVPLALVSVGVDFAWHVIIVMKWSRGDPVDEVVSAIIQSNGRAPRAFSAGAVVPGGNAIPTQELLGVCRSGEEDTEQRCARSSAAHAAHAARAAAATARSPWPQRGKRATFLM